MYRCENLDFCVGPVDAEAPETPSHRLCNSMRRIIGILLCMCLMLVCALVAWFGMKQLEPATQDAARENAEPLQQVTCAQLLERIPDHLEEFELIEFYPGKRSIGIDANNDGRWERVYIPVFDKPLKDIRRNYRAVVVCFAGVADEIELRQQLQSGGLRAQYWPYSQKFDKVTYNAIAERYSSLNFNRSIMIHCGFPKSAGTARYLFWGGAAGALLALLAMGWQSLGLIAIVIQKSAADEQAQDDDEDEDVQEFLNRAGLPTIKRE